MGLLSYLQLASSCTTTIGIQRDTNTRKKGCLKTLSGMLTLIMPRTHSQEVYLQKFLNIRLQAELL